FLGTMYSRGEGVAKDNVEAFAYLSLAARTREDATKARDSLALKMSAEQTAAGHKRTRELRAMIEQKAENVEALERQAGELYEKGKYEQAIPIAEQVLEYCERAFGSEHTNTAAALNSLALRYKRTAAYAKA